MSFAKVSKKYFWLLLIIIYFLVIVYRVNSNGTQELISLGSIGFYVASIQLLYTNFNLIRKPFVWLYYWLLKIQFEWQFHVSITASEDSIKSIDQKMVKSLICDILDKSGFSNRKKDIVVSKVTQGFVVYIPPFGLNIEIKHYPAGPRDADDEMMYKIFIKGQTLINYRQTKKLLISFLKKFLYKIEESLKEIEDKKYVLKVSSGEMESDFYKDQFIKGIDKVDHFSITSTEDTYDVTINMRFIEIISEYKEDIIDNANKYLLQLR